MQTIMIVEDDPDIRDGVRIALDCNRVWVDEQEADLTETEYKILKLLMQSPHRIFPVQVIYETVWGEPYFYVSNGTVMVHIRNLRMKVEHNPQNPQRICTVWGKGYRFAAQDISVRFVKENGKAGLAFENAVLPGQHRTDSTKVGLTSIETMMEKMHAACRMATVIGAMIGTFIVGKLFHFYPVEGMLTAGLCMANGGGAGDVQCLGAAHRMELMSYAQISSRIGGAIMLVIASFVFGKFL